MIEYSSPLRGLCRRRELFEPGILRQVAGSSRRTAGQMRVGGLSLIRRLLCLGFGICAPLAANGTEAHMAAVGTVGGGGGSYLKLVRIQDPGGTPTTAEVELDISGVFGESVRDLAFLARSPGGNPRIAVVGNCIHQVPFEEDPWWGNSHHIGGTVAFYEVQPDPLALVAAGSVEFASSFDTTWLTVDTGTLASTPGESYRIAGLPSGGFLVAANGCRRACSLAGCIDDIFNSYSHLHFFDSGGTMHFAASGPAPIQTPERDIAGLAGAPPDQFVWPYQGTAGDPGEMYRYRVDWSHGGIVWVATLDGVATGGCYYLAQVASLPRLPGHVVDGGCVVRNHEAATYNSTWDYPDGTGLSNSNGWGYLWPGGPAIDELVGIGGCEPDAGVFMRRNDTDYSLYHVAASDGAYTDSGFAFAWGGTPWTLVRSDGEVLGTAVPRAVDGLRIEHDGTNAILTWLPMPGASSYEVSSSDDLSGSFAVDGGGTFGGERWEKPTGMTLREFFSVLAK